MKKSAHRKSPLSLESLESLLSLEPLFEGAEEESS
jgi:hypothetical protein